MGNVPRGPEEQVQEQGGYASAPCNPVTLSFTLDLRQKNKKIWKGKINMSRTLGAKNKKHKRRSKKLLIAKNMPPLYHTLPGQDFAREKSQVLKWLADAPEIQDWVMEQLKSAGYIVYDPNTGRWCGVDYGV